MDHSQNLSSPRRKCLGFLLKLVLIESVIFVAVTSGDQTNIPPTGLLCISDCAACPVICSPPPPPQLPESKPPPSPPKSHQPPPSESPPLLPPPSESPPLLPPPPPSSIWWGYSPPPSSPGYVNSPPIMGQHNYTYPYYYYYTSKAASLSLHAPFVLMATLSFPVVVLDCLMGI